MLKAKTKKGATKIKYHGTSAECITDICCIINSYFKHIATKEDTTKEDIEALYIALTTGISWLKEKIITDYFKEEN